VIFRNLYNLKKRLRQSLDVNEYKSKYLIPNYSYVLILDG